MLGARLESQEQAGVALVVDQFGFGREEDGAQVRILADKIAVFPSQKEPPVAFGGVITFDFRSPRGCGSLVRPLMPRVILVPVSPVGSAGWRYYHRIG